MENSRPSSVRTRSDPTLPSYLPLPGTWAMTVASVSQALVCLNFGIKRIVIANQIVGASNLRSLAAAINSYSFVQFYCLVDSVASVKHLADGLKHPVYSI